ncbi:MAG: ABC transporter ATP-binding protein [Thermoleophilia bacterium]
MSIGAVRQRFASRGGQVVEALDRVDLEIAPGEFVAIVGPSGCGKTTLLRLVAGFMSPTEGEVAVGGAPVSGPSPQRGVVFQRPNLYPWMSVRANVAFGPRVRGVGRVERREIADRHLAMVGLSEFADAAPYELSGGMRQRCQIAAVLANAPPILLLDEPFGALDALTRDRLQDELHAIWRASPGTTALFVTHNVEEAVYLGTRVLVMSPRPGRVVLDEPVPFDPAARRSSLRATPEFIAARERIAAAIRAS